ncbi:MAG: GNAT family N-acetyltransferase [Dehalococcoidia bacterium]|nr:MAG: GNAT family N-acetyltransferase [Dehalococcoidia bacterium]
MAQTLERGTSGGGSLRPGPWEVRELRQRREVRAWLAVDRPFSAYALGHLEGGLLEYARFWVAEGRGSGAGGLVMHANALGQSMVTVGDPEAIAAIVSIHPGPRATYLTTAAREHTDALRDAYLVGNVLTMRRMSVTRGDFAPVNGLTRRLRGRDAGRINWLYSIEGGRGRYFPNAIEQAIYYGVVEGDLLVAVAGTHIVAPNEGVAVVGNVFTHPEYRGRGYAERVTSAVTAELFERGCSEVVLTVDPQNTPAVAAYTHLGFRPGSEVVEARLRRRDAFGIAPWWRRSRAVRRGRTVGSGMELVDARPVLAREDR